MDDRSDRRSVLVGFDGSAASQHALHWAVQEARLRDVPLVVCHAWHWPYPMRAQDEDALKIIQGMGAIVVEEGVLLARQVVAGLRVTPELRKGTASGALVEMAQESALTVLGTRGGGGLGGLAVGSAAAQVPAHTDRPVVLVPPRTVIRALQTNRVVVGVDGSAAGDAALGFAFGEAALRESVVTVVCGWWDPGALPGPERLPFTDPETVKQHAKARFQSALESCQAAYPKVPVEQRFVLERPQRVLADIAEGASLLVVGARGAGSAPKNLLGAVTRAVMHQAPCPIAIVHEETAL